jgi:hypothetical protein
MQFDAGQFSALIDAIKGSSNIFTIANGIALAATTIALISALFSYLAYRRTRRLYIADLHSAWWSRDFEEDRAIVWQQLEEWERLGAASPAIIHYSSPKKGWGIRSEERRAHGRILFFFADLNTLIRYGLIESNLAFEFFGVSQYDFFRKYFHAIREARMIRAAQPGAIEPRWVKEIDEFERRLDAWKVSRL